MGEGLSSDRHNFVINQHVAAGAARLERWMRAERYGWDTGRRIFGQLDLPDPTKEDFLLALEFLRTTPCPLTRKPHV